MSKRVSQFGTRIVIASVLAIVGASATLGANPPAAAQSPPSKEMREKMATLHEQMAACLRSDKSMTECRTEMMKDCQDVVGKDGCPMMGMGWGRRHHMMQAPPANSGDQK
jgi:hypothetical protein